MMMMMMIVPQFLCDYFDEGVELPIEDGGWCGENEERDKNNGKEDNDSNIM